MLSELLNVCKQITEWISNILELKNMKIYVVWILLAIYLSSCKVLENKDLIFEKHFGGIADGKTDNYEAFIRLADFLKNKKNIKVIFKEGVYLINQYKYADCRSYGYIECLKQFKGNGVQDIVFEGSTIVEFVGNKSSIPKIYSGQELIFNDVQKFNLKREIQNESIEVRSKDNGATLYDKLRRYKLLKTQYD